MQLGNKQLRKTIPSTLSSTPHKSKYKTCVVKLQTSEENEQVRKPESETI
jgi:hypothetical protein